MHVRSLVLVVLAFTLGRGFATDEREASFNIERSDYHIQRAAPVSPDSRDSRKYAPDLTVRVLHLALDITPNFKERSIQGRAVMRFRPNVLPATEVRLDAVKLRVRSVVSSEEIQSWNADDEAITVTYAHPIPADREASLTIEYEASPLQGLYFRTPEMGYKEGDTHLFSQGESITARHWYPCMDSPNVMFTSEITCRVPEGMTVISNGRLVSEGKDGGDGLKLFHWSQEQPHANYLLTLVAGYFQKVEDKHRDIPLAFFTPPSDIQQASNSFRSTKEMMEFFEEETGVPYPWPKYYQVCVNDFVAGGMENTSATTLTDSTLFSSATENIQTSESLVAHELAHQWFGDLVTCKDWSHIWLNEGFATYYENLWQGRRYGRDQMLFELYRNAQTILGAGGTPAPIVRRTYGGPDDMFGYLSYDKGNWVLHMLRSQLGEELYRKCVHLFLERHRHGNVVTEDFRKIIEELSGRSYDQFFDQWLYHAHHPEIEANYSWDQAATMARVSIRQVQKLSTNVLLFNIPLTVRFKGTFGSIDRVMQVTRDSEDFSFHLASAPETVRFDPDYTLLAKIQFTPPAPMLDRQLTNKDDLIGRLFALESIGKRQDSASLAKIKRALNEDAFYGVRVAASKALRALHTPEALEALMQSGAQPDARVRRQVADDIGGFYDDKAYEFARARLKEEKNPAILGTLIRDMGAYSKDGLRETLEGYLVAPSYHNELANASVGAIRLQDDPASIQPLLNTLSQRQREFTSGGFMQGLSALAYLARNEEDKTKVREFLVNQLDTRRRGVRTAALNAFGTLGDAKAIAVVEKFAAGTLDDRERSAASSALVALRGGRKPIDDLRVLRQEVMDLQTSDRDLRKELEDLKRSLKEFKSISQVTNAAVSAPQKGERRRAPAIQTPKDKP